MNSDFVVRADVGFSLQLKNFASKLGTHQVVLGLLPADVSDAIAASDYFKFVLDMQIAHAERVKNWTTYKDLLRNPGAGVPPTSAAPVTLAVPVAPTAAPLGIEVWFRQIAKRIKGSKNFTDAIGNDLGIMSINSVIDLNLMRPALTLSLIAGQPLITWKKDGMDGIEIFKKNAEGEWSMLVFDSRPNHLDTSPLPTLGVSVQWSYKAIYRFQDKRVGSWSNEVSITVTGEI
jgi:hypothetical protein